MPGVVIYASMSSVGTLTAVTRITVDLRSAEATYAQVARQLREQIESGELAPGDRIPSVHELVQMTGLSPGTVTKAVRVLHDAGLVVRAPGRGVYVRDRALG